MHDVSKACLSDKYVCKGTAAAMSMLDDLHTWTNETIVEK